MKYNELFTGVGICDEVTSIECNYHNARNVGKLTCV